MRVKSVNINDALPNTDIPYEIEIESDTQESSFPITVGLFRDGQFLWSWKEYVDLDIGTNYYVGVISNWPEGNYMMCADIMDGYMRTPSGVCKSFVISPTVTPKGCVVESFEYYIEYDRTRPNFRIIVEVHPPCKDVPVSAIYNNKVVKSSTTNVFGHAALSFTEEYRGKSLTLKVDDLQTTTVTSEPYHENVIVEAPKCVSGRPGVWITIPIKVTNDSSLPLRAFELYIFAGDLVNYIDFNPREGYTFKAQQINPGQSVTFKQEIRIKDPSFTFNALAVKYSGLVGGDIIEDSFLIEVYNIEKRQPPATCEEKPPAPTPTKIPPWLLAAGAVAIGIGLMSGGKKK